MLQKLFVSYQLCTDPLRKEWLLAAPALRRPAIAEPTRCAKDQTAAGDTLPPQGLCWARLSLSETCPRQRHPRGLPGPAGLQTRCRAAAWVPQRGPGLQRAERAMKVGGAESDEHLHTPAHPPATPMARFAPCLLQCSAPLRTWHGAGAMQGARLPHYLQKRGPANAASTFQGGTGCVDKGGAIGRAHPPHQQHRGWQCTGARCGAALPRRGSRCGEGLRNGMGLGLGRAGGKVAGVS